MGFAKSGPPTPMLKRLLRSSELPQPNASTRARFNETNPSSALGFLTVQDLVSDSALRPSTVLEGVWVSKSPQ